ncbi:hypothetical protein EXIGLDRAFT_832810 [Exidia glandulosa HHB12029]|uniref:Uncharacterized protein n=1 Tax=Exidia glandulosa HHB12029 TaxID=1314781 RepID=A0A165L9J0_EXIGL|nr:hypothetical protein EXIGLDRAFT_832810 [Exidia glandulosa HHB12029]
MFDGPVNGRDGASTACTVQCAGHSTLPVYLSLELSIMTRCRQVQKPAAGAKCRLKPAQTIATLVQAQRDGTKIRNGGSGIITDEPITLRGSQTRKYRLLFSSPRLGYNSTLVTIKTRCQIFSCYIGNTRRVEDDECRAPEVTSPRDAMLDRGDSMARSRTTHSGWKPKRSSPLAGPHVSTLPLDESYCIAIVLAADVTGQPRKERTPIPWKPGTFKFKRRKVPSDEYLFPNLDIEISAPVLMPILPILQQKSTVGATCTPSPPPPPAEPVRCLESSTLVLAVFSIELYESSDLSPPPTCICPRPVDSKPDKPLVHVPTPSVKPSKRKRRGRKPKPKIIIKPFVLPSNPTKSDYATIAEQITARRAVGRLDLRRCVVTRRIDLELRKMEKELKRAEAKLEQVSGNATSLVARVPRPMVKMALGLIKCRPPPEARPRERTWRERWDDMVDLVTVSEARSRSCTTD